MRGKNTNCQCGPTNRTAFQCYHRFCTTRDSGRHDDKRKRVNELETPLSPVVQNEAPVLNPVSFEMGTRNDEISADVPLPEQPAKVSGDQSQGWITEEAFFAVSPGARQVRQRKEIKMSLLTPAERREFLKSMDTEWQTLLKRQAAEVSPLQKKRLELECVGQILRWLLVGLVSGRQTTAWTWRQGTTHHKEFHRS